MRWWKEWIDSFNNVVELPDPLITELHSKGYSYDDEKESDTGSEKSLHKQY